jgi:hypothetical protein
MQNGEEAIGLSRFVDDLSGDTFTAAGSHIPAQQMGGANRLE